MAPEIPKLIRFLTEDLNFRLRRRAKASGTLRPPWARFLGPAQGRTPVPGRRARYAHNRSFAFRSKRNRDYQRGQ